MNIHEWKELGRRPIELSLVRVGEVALLSATISPATVTGKGTEGGPLDFTAKGSQIETITLGITNGGLAPVYMAEVEGRALAQEFQVRFVERVTTGKEVVTNVLYEPPLQPAV